MGGGAQAKNARGLAGELRGCNIVTSSLTTLQRYMHIFTLTWQRAGHSRWVRAPALPPYAGSLDPSLHPRPPPQAFSSAAGAACAVLATLAVAWLSVFAFAAVVLCGATLFLCKQARWVVDRRLPLIPPSDY